MCENPEVDGRASFKTFEHRKRVPFLEMKEKEDLILKVSTDETKLP
jgi:hypothetical protein